MTNSSAFDSDLRGNSRSGMLSKKTLIVCFSAALMAAMLQGCGGGTIQGVTGQTGIQGSAHFQLSGQGVCDRIRIDFGDGTPPADYDNYDFANSSPAIDHIYRGWGGKKTVTVGSVTNCAGTAKIIFTVGKPQEAIALAGKIPTACADASAALSQGGVCSGCVPAPASFLLRKNTLVHITTNPDPNVKIGFGCLFSGCVYNADGILNSTADPSYPFPGLRALSLVLRVGTQVVQGGTDVSFTTNQAGPLELCINDNNLSDNTGAWGVFVAVDESAAQ